MEPLSVPSSSTSSTGPPVYPPRPSHHHQHAHHQPAPPPTHVMSATSASASTSSRASHPRKDQNPKELIRAKKLSSTSMVETTKTGIRPEKDYLSTSSQTTPLESSTLNVSDIRPLIVLAFCSYSHRLSFMSIFSFLNLTFSPLSHS